MRRRKAIARAAVGAPRACAVTLCALTGLCAAAPAGADVFGPASLVSQGTVPGAPEVQQAEYTHDTAISGDGRYIVFDGSFHGVTGVWRAEIQEGHVAGEIEQVAGGDAELPSISENGQYVSFTTNEGKSLAEITYGLLGELPEHREGVKEAVNVYVRDMSINPTQVGAFIIVSAQNGSEAPLTYSGAETNSGAVAAGRSAIDGEGNEVAFVTTAISNLVNPAEVNTPRLQVAVRYLASRQTRLVSQDRETGGPVSVQEGGRVLGAVYSDSVGGFFAFEPPAAFGGAMPPPGASISADGSTVAWLGEDIAEQATMLASEKRSPNYTEPLWRRIEPGSETATERVTGGSDPANPACATSGETRLPSPPSTTDPCQGPFVLEEAPISGGTWIGGQQGDPVPRLSADGYTVAFLSRAPLVTAGENFGLGTGGQESDLYVADMHSGLTRDQALTQLTELAGGAGAGLGDTAQIYDFGISPDGSQVAFSTERTQFPLGSPAFVSPPAGEPGMDELFDADLADNTLTRVTHGYQGPEEAGEHAHPRVLAGEDPYQSQPGDGSISPSFSDDGRIIAFASTASNLLFGDGNASPAGPLDGSDAFLVQRAIFQPRPTPQDLSPAPQVSTQPAWQMGVTAVSRADGSVLLYIRAPGAGTLRALAQSSVEIAAGGRSTRGKPARRARGARSSGRAARPREIVAIRTVASAARVAQSTGGELIVLALKLAKSYGALAFQRGGLSSLVTVTFATPGQPTLHESVQAAFVSTAKAARRRGKAAAHRGQNKKGPQR